MKNSRRNFLKTSTTFALGAIAVSSILNGAFDNNHLTTQDLALAEDGEYTLPKLPYAYDALEPHIDKLTMEIHHSKHHKAYVENMNKELKALDPTKLKEDHSFENIFDSASKIPAALRNNAGGHFNHSLFWTLMKPNGGGTPSGKIGDAIATSFGSFDEFKNQFNEAATKRFGSGWAWLVKGDQDQLMITSTANQDNPQMNLDSVEIKGKPLLALDVWEHAYYLKNQNRRADYIASFWHVVNWEKVEELFVGA